MPATTFLFFKRPKEKVAKEKGFSITIQKPQLKLDLSKEMPI
jgi:hypothetical protein